VLKISARLIPVGIPKLKPVSHLFLNAGLLLSREPHAIPAVLLLGGLLLEAPRRTTPGGPGAPSDPPLR